MDGDNILWSLLHAPPFIASYPIRFNDLAAKLLRIPDAQQVMIGVSSEGTKASTDCLDISCNGRFFDGSICPSLNSAGVRTSSITAPSE